MLEQDYLMRLLLQFFKAMVDSLNQSHEEKNPQAAAETIENAISNATDLDGAALLSLSPESIASVMKVSGVNPDIIGYIAHGMLLESVYLDEAGNYELARVRESQAKALAEGYGVELPEDPSDFSKLERQAEKAEAELYGEDNILADLSRILQ